MQTFNLVAECLVMVLLILLPIVLYGIGVFLIVSSAIFGYTQIKDRADNLYISVIISLLGFFLSVVLFKAAHILYEILN